MSKIDLLFYVYYDFILMLTVDSFILGFILYRLGRGFEVRMKALEEAVSCERPQDNELLTMVHSRLLCTAQELKGLKSGENKYPYRLP